MSIDSIIGYLRVLDETDGDFGDLADMLESMAKDVK